MSVHGSALSVTNSFQVQQRKWKNRSHLKKNQEADTKQERKYEWTRSATVEENWSCKQWRRRSTSKKEKRTERSSVSGSKWRRVVVIRAMSAGRSIRRERNKRKDGLGCVPAWFLAFCYCCSLPPASPCARSASLSSCFIHPSLPWLFFSLSWLSSSHNSFP